MSIASEISRLQTAKSDIRASIQNHGVPVPPYEFGEFQQPATDGWYLYCQDQVTTGDVVTVKLTDYTTYRVGFHIRSGLDLGGNTGRLWDSGWKTADYSTTISATYNRRYINIIVGKRNGSAITKEEAESALAEFSVTPATLSNYSKYIDNIRNAAEVKDTTIQKVVVSEWTDIQKFTNENLTEENYLQDGVGWNTKGAFYIEIKEGDNFYGSVSVNSDSILKYAILLTDSKPTSGENLYNAFSTGWKTQSGTGELSTLNHAYLRRKYICFEVTYISPGYGVPTLEEVKSNATFQILTKFATKFSKEEDYIGTGTSVNAYQYIDNIDLVHVMLPPSIITIGNYAFRNCPNLRTINLGGVTQQFGAQCFYRCTSLALDVCLHSLSYGIENSFVSTNIHSFRLDSSNRTYLSFDQCSELEKVDIPSSVTYYGNYMFRDCVKLKYIDLSNVTMLATGVFQRCRSLNIIVDMPNLTKMEGDGNFNETGITGVENLGTTETITGFSGCTSLEYVKLPSTTTSIGNYAFRRDTSLSTVYCYASTPPTMGATPFQNCPLIAIYVPSESVSDYQSATGWSAFASIIQAIS